MRTMPQPVALSGDLDMFGAPAIRLALERLQGPGVVDMREVRYLDSSALNELARLARRVGPHQVTLVVASVNVRRVLAIVEFEKLFTIVEVVRPLQGVPMIDRDAGLRSSRPAYALP